MKQSEKDETVWSHKIGRYATIAATIFGTMAATTTAAETLTVCYDQWPPLTIFPTEEASKRGIVIDMLVEIYGNQGFEIVFEEVPLARGLAMVSEGLCDMLPEFPGSEGDDDDFVYGTVPTFLYTTAFVVQKGDEWRYDGVDSLAGKRIATGPGWDYSAMSVDYQNYLTDEVNADRIEIVSGYNDIVDRILLMIANERVDLYADNEIVLHNIVSETGLADRVEIVRPGLEGVMRQRPIFSKTIPENERENLIRIWDEGRITIQGERESNILEQYNVEIPSVN